MPLWQVLGLLAAAPPSAPDGFKAIYVGRGGSEPAITFEVAADGDFRAETDASTIFIRRGGRTYLILGLPDGAIVADVDDLAAVAQETVAKLGGERCDRQAPATLTGHGTATVEGRIGEAYTLTGRGGLRAELVISHDPALAPIGAAVAAQLKAATSMFGRCASSTPMSPELFALLHRGTMLQLGAVSLAKVEPQATDPARLALPAAPATRDQLRAMFLARTLGLRTAPPGPPAVANRR